MEKRLTYNVRFIAPGIQFGAKRFGSYRTATQEAESWVLSGKDYTSIIEWTTLTGDKTTTFDYSTVQQQRKARNTYKKSIKKNLVRKPYVAI